MQAASGVFSDPARLLELAAFPFVRSGFSAHFTVFRELVQGACVRDPGEPGGQWGREGSAFAAGGGPSLLRQALDAAGARNPLVELGKVRLQAPGRG